MGMVASSGGVGWFDDDLGPVPPLDFGKHDSEHNDALLK